jgi:hypothetical protein
MTVPMTASTPRAVAAAPWGQFPAVLDGVTLDGAEAKLAALLDPGFLSEAGWDPVMRVLTLPAEHRLLGRTLCRVGGCTATARGDETGGVCWRCFTRLGAEGLDGPQIACSPELPPLPASPAGCSVPGCQRMSPAPRSTLCEPHRRRFRRTPGMSLREFLADPWVRALPPLGPCQVAACSRRAEGGHGYCPTHYVRWRTAAATAPDTDQRHWELTQSAVPQGGQVSLRGLPPRVVVEVLFGTQQRVRGGAKITDVTLRAVCDTLRREQAPGIEGCRDQCVPGKPARALLAALASHVRRALTDPGREQAGDSWDLAVFGHRGRLSFTAISQPWLAQAAKTWAGQELPRHRGGGANNVREKVNALARLSESLRARDDHGHIPERLGRGDVEAFLGRSPTSNRPARSAATTATSSAGAPGLS